MSAQAKSTILQFQYNKNLGFLGKLVYLVLCDTVTHKMCSMFCYFGCLAL
jgi:hypothetical protein